MTDVILPKLNQSGANEWADVEDNDVAIREVVNGELDNGNLSGAAGITDANLASPNNVVYRTLLLANGAMVNDAVAGTRYFAASGAITGSNAAGNVITGGAAGVVPMSFYFDDADYTVAGKTQKLRLRAQAHTNEVQPTLEFTLGLYPITFAGGSDTLTVKLGTVVSGSTVVISSPAASSTVQGNSGDFTVPSDGPYCFGVVNQFTLTNGSAIAFSVQLQARNV